MCAQKLTYASLIYRTEPKIKTRKMKKLKSKNGYAQRNGAGQKTVESVRRGEGSLGWKCTLSPCVCQRTGGQVYPMVALV